MRTVGNILLGLLVLLLALCGATYAAMELANGMEREEDE
jgi:hypothetical protein